MGKVQDHLQGALPSVYSKDCPLWYRHTADRRRPCEAQAPEEKQ